MKSVRYANGLRNWKHGTVETALQQSSTALLPNNALQLTASSLRYAPAFGSS
jgi:hypothetical protein